MASARALAIESVTVRSGRIACSVRIPDARQRYSNPQLARYLAQLRPNLERHTCVNDDDAPLARVMDRTSVPHLLEHLVIDLQTERSADPRAVFVGITCWTDEPAGAALVEVSFADDLECLRALRDAARILDDAVIRFRV